MTHVIRLSEEIPKHRATRAARKTEYPPDSASALLDELDRRKLAHRQFKVGCDLFRPGERHDAIYKLVDGWAARYMVLKDGGRQILHFALPGEILGFAPSHMMTYGVQALTDVAVHQIPYQRLYALLQEQPEAGMQLACLISRDRSLAYDRLARIGRHSARERVAHLLLELFIRSRMQWPGYRIEEMHLPLTQEHIGDATGLTGVHVNRVLRDLRTDGILEFHYRRLRILNPDKLVEVAEIDPYVVLSWLRDERSSAAAVDGERDVLPHSHVRRAGSHGSREAWRKAPGRQREAGDVAAL